MGAGQRGCRRTIPHDFEKNRGLKLNSIHIPERNRLRRNRAAKAIPSARHDPPGMAPTTWRFPTGPYQAALAAGGVGSDGVPDDLNARFFEKGTPMRSKTNIPVFEEMTWKMSKHTAKDGRMHSPRRRGWEQHGIICPWNGYLYAQESHAVPAPYSGARTCMQR